jgi:hypothetical protein
MGKSDHLLETVLRLPSPLPELDVRHERNAAVRRVVRQSDSDVRHLSDSGVRH